MLTIICKFMGTLPAQPKSDRPGQRKEAAAD
jgi:hypothetical protein